MVADVGAREAAGGRPIRPGRRTVVAQGGHQVRNHQAAFAGLQEFARAALPAAGVGETGEEKIGITAAEVEIVPVAAPAARDRV